jgi:hypothetical protein
MKSLYCPSSTLLLGSCENTQVSALIYLPELEWKSLSSLVPLSILQISSSSSQCSFQNTLTVDDPRFFKFPQALDQ